MLYIAVHPVFSQKGKNKHFTSQSYQYPLYKWTGNYSKHGIQLSFGPTYLLTKMYNDTRTITNSPNSFTQYNHHASGRIGGFLEIGMVHIAHKRNKIIHYYDWGIGFKYFQGIEKTRAYDYSSGIKTSIGGTGKFGLGYVYGRFAIHNVAQIGRYVFIDNALGINLDYAILKNASYSGTSFPVSQHFQKNFLTQLNYSLGIGFKIRDGFFIVPGVAVPFFGIYEWSGSTPAIHWFSSVYQPIQAQIKFVWLFKRDPNKCPPVYGGPDDEKLQEQYLNQ
jgi:hypothetical protein